VVAAGEVQGSVDVADWLAYDYANRITGVTFFQFRVASDVPTNGDNTADSVQIYVELECTFWTP
jgi:hypothetical protein